MLFLVYKMLERMQMFHRDRHYRVVDVHRTTAVRVWCGCEDLVYHLKCVLYQDKANGHVG